MDRPLQPARPKAVSRFAVGAAGAAVLLLAACSGGSSENTGPFIGAVVVSFPAGEAPAGFDSNASVAVLDPSTGAPIPTAAVTVNGTVLPFDAVLGEYVGNVAVAPGNTIALAVAIGGRVYDASGAQFDAYPQVQAPAAGDVWAAYSAHDVDWSPGAPSADAVYALGILDARNPNGDALWPTTGGLQGVPAGTTSFAIPADALTVGDRLVVVGLTREVAIQGAFAGSVLVIGGFTYAPVHVMDDSGRMWEVAASTGIPDWTTLRGITWTGTQLVAVGNTTVLSGSCPQFGIVLTSPDALSWTPRVGGCADVTTQVLSGVASSGTQIVAVGGPAILSSSDGVTWTNRSGAEGQFLLDVAWSGSAFVAVGAGGGVLTSPDGITWTAATSGTPDDLSGVAWNGTRLVVAGTYGTVIVSDDGTAWSPATSGTTSGLGGVASSATATVVVGQGGTILASADGLSWSPVGSGNDNFHGVASSGQRFAAVGQAGAIATSADGTAWTARISPRAYDLWGAAWDGTRWVAVGELGTVLLSP